MDLLTDMTDEHSYGIIEWCETIAKAGKLGLTVEYNKDFHAMVVYRKGASDNYVSTVMSYDGLLSFMQGYQAGDDNE